MENDGKSFHTFQYLQPGTEEGSPVLQFHAGVGLGMFMARIFEEHFSDVCGAKVKN
jgi:hypothetical protein